MKHSFIPWLIIGWVGFLIAPWYILEDGFWSFVWLTDGYPTDMDYASAILQGLLGDRVWLLPLIVPLLFPLRALVLSKGDERYSRCLIISGACGLAYLLIQGFAVGVSGWQYEGISDLLGVLEQHQYGMGYGAVLCGLSFLILLTTGLAAAGFLKGDVFVTSSIGLIIALVGLFVFYPVAQVLFSAFINNDGFFAPLVFFEKLSSSNIWSPACIVGPGACGIALNSLSLALSTAVITTLLGLAFALVVTRTDFRWKKSLRLLTVLPIITPPFVIGLALILLFGRSGVVTGFFAELFSIEPSRWIYGMPGVLFAQVLSFTPISFLVLIGVVEGVSPSMEEASQTLRANRWKTFVNVSLPLMRPGLANAFLLSFIESLADFGNPMVLGGDFEVLSTEIFFAIVGAQNDQGYAAVLAIVLLAFTLTAFFIQRRWLGKKSYITVTGKADSGTYMGLNTGMRVACYTAALPWAALTVVIYGMIMFGGFVQNWGYDNSFTLEHYTQAFSVSWGEFGIIWKGAAWDSLWTTLSISAIAAPFTAFVGLLTAYLLVRQQFKWKEAFEFGTMLSFAIPGTVIGISYILAFNVPPFELTGTGVILIICFVFRNMPVGVRGGIAAMSQLDKSLDEASLTLGANSFRTFRRVIMPLLRPAIIAALVYSFVRAITSVSAVIFLVSADHNMATSYIIGLVENGEFGIAIAYCSVLIVIMLTVIVAINLLVGQRRLRGTNSSKSTQSNSSIQTPSLKEKQA